jgi:hypothetical protein
MVYFYPEHKSYLYLHGIQMLNIPTIYRQSPSNPLQTNKEPYTYLEGQLLAHGDEFPSTLAPSLVITAPTFILYPFHPFPTPQPTLHCYRTTSTITVFFVWDDKYNHKHEHQHQHENEHVHVNELANLHENSNGHRHGHGHGHDKNMEMDMNMT